jgi:hypothetical protein
MNHGGDRKSEAFDQTANLRNDQAAQMLNVSTRSVEAAKQVQENGAPELVAAVDSGKVSVSAAAEVAKLPKEEQAKVVAQGATADKAKEQREKRKAEKAAKQAENDAARAAAADALPQAIKDHQKFKADAIASKKAQPVDVDALQAEVEQGRETIASLEAENANLKAEIKRFDEMRVQFEKGGFEEVIKGKDEEIRVLKGRLEQESGDKVAYLNKAEWWKKKAIELGYSSREVIDLDA